MSKYPEHEKLKAVQPMTQKFGEFFNEFLGEKEVELAYWINGSELSPIHCNPMEFVAEFFGIDQRKLEQEKRAMLGEQRALNEASR